MKENQKDYISTYFDDENFIEDDNYRTFENSRHLKNENFSKKTLEIIVLGEENVGKTQIINQLVSEKFDQHYSRTYSPQENFTTIKIKEDGVIKSKDLNIYDIPGINGINTINKSFLRTAEIVLLVYDMTNIESFIKLYDWNELLLKNKDILKCVIANKRDLIERQICEENGKKFAEKIGALYYETSAKINVYIYDLFSQISSTYADPCKKILVKPGNSIEIKKNEKKRKESDSCCDGYYGELIPGDKILYKLKINSQKEKNVDKENNEEKEIIKLINGMSMEIFKNQNLSILNLKNEIKLMNFDSEIDKLKFKDCEVYMKGNNFVNLINILLFVNNSKVIKQKNDIENNFYTLDNNFVMKIKLLKEKMILDNNTLKDIDLILFVFDKFEEDFIINFKSLHKRITEKNNKALKFGIVGYKMDSENQEIKEFFESLNAFYEETDEDIIDDYFLQDIMNKHLDHFENKVFYEGSYYGDIKDNKKDGFGIIIEDEGIYIGNWKNDVKEGYGNLINLSEFEKHGEWKNDILFEGEFNSLKEGNFKIFQGKIEGFFSEFLKYEGTMEKEDLYGKLEIKNGIIYEGKFKNNHNHFDEGEGTISYPNGNIYKGAWKNYRKNGRGTIYTNEGIIIESL